MLQQLVLQYRVITFSCLQLKTLSWTYAVKIGNSAQTVHSAGPKIRQKAEVQFGPELEFCE